MATDLQELARNLGRHWSRDTSADSARWSPENPSHGQCAVTALVVQDHFGGELLRARVDGISHYWNRLPSGAEVDLTRQQFGPDVQVPAGEPRPRSFVLSFPDTVDRYLLLRHALGLSAEVKVTPSAR